MGLLLPAEAVEASGVTALMELMIKRIATNNNKRRDAVGLFIVIQQLAGQFTLVSVCELPSSLYFFGMNLLMTLD